MSDTKKSTDMTVQDACIAISEMESIDTLSAFIEGDERTGVTKAAQSRVGELVLSGAIEAPAPDAKEKEREAFYSIMVPKDHDPRGVKQIPVTVINESGFHYHARINRGQKIIHNVPAHAVHVLGNAVERIITMDLSDIDTAKTGARAPMNEEKQHAYPFVVVEGPYYERKTEV